MELTRENWNKNDIKEFQLYLKSNENFAKKEWATNILRTQLPVLCLTTPVIKDTVKKISKGNYIEFLDYMLWEYYENTAINGFLICQIKDFDLMKKYLDIYSSKADNWATCDLLTFDTVNHKDEFYKLSQEYVKSDKPFVKRIGLYILFNYLDDDKYIDAIFKTIDKFKNEEHYYVNMMLSWLLSDCFIKQREKTSLYLDKCNLSKFVMNAFVQKCRDSRRVSAEDKEMLLKYKIK